MASGKQEEGFKGILKNLFGISSRKNTAEQLGNVRPHQPDYVITEELLKEIKPGAQLSQRLKVVRDLCEVVLNKSLEPNAAEVLWGCVKDLLAPAMHREAHIITLKFLACLCKGQYEQLGITRHHFFQVVKNHDVFEDLSERLEVFRMLSQDGKDLKFFEGEAGAFLLDWMRDVISSSKVPDYLQVLVNVMKYNAAYVDEEIVSGFVLNTCLIATKTCVNENIELCLLLLDTIVRYSFLPRSSLYHFIVCMCQIVNVDKFTQEAWKLIKKLLGTHLGHTAIYSMCCLLQNKNSASESEAQLMRGAVFFIGMALWGSQKVESLKHPHTAVLPAFIQAIDNSGSNLVAYEIALSVHRLVSKYGKELQNITWDGLLDLLAALLSHIKIHCEKYELLKVEVDKVIGCIEYLIEKEQFTGNQDRFFTMLETCVLCRPESSVLMLMNYKAKQINMQEECWLAQLQQIMDKYYREESRTGIRLALLDILSRIFASHRAMLEEVLLEKVVVPYLQPIDNDCDVEVRRRAVTLLVDVSMTCTSSAVADVITILRKIVLWPFSHPEQPHCSPPSPVPGSPQSMDRTRKLSYPELADLVTAVQGLIGLLKAKLHQCCGSILVEAFSTLIAYLKEEYSPTHLRPRGGQIRKAIFECLLQLRADSLCRLGFPDANKLSHITYSPYAFCTERDNFDAVIDGTTVVNKAVVLPYGQVFTMVRLCLEQEIDWHVLKAVLDRLPQVLQNKTLLLCATREDLHGFCMRLTVMVSDRNVGIPEKLLNAAPRFTKSDFHAHIFPVLSCLVSYHHYLDKQKQHELVKCLEFGLVSKCARICVRSLTVCALENPDVMMRQLPSVLLRLSQISATVNMAVPLMEFLSSLLHLPDLYVNFVEDQYMSIFAIALPYTNPCKYTHYTVSLAHHVIAMWFLKCRISFRKDFVSFIVKGLRANVLRQFDETARARARQNQDSSDRNRTQSLNDEALRSSQAAAEEADQSKGRNRVAAQAALQARGSAHSHVSPPPGQMPDEDMSSFHRELTETCIDMLATYTFSTFASLPKRSPTTDFLLNGGQRQSWLMGNRIVTVTTSGGAKVTKAGLCEKCLNTARAASAQQQHQEPEPEVKGRRRHKSAAVGKSSETIALKRSSQDDMLLRRREDLDLMPSQPGPLPRIPSEGLDSTEDLRRHGALETRTGKIQAVDNVLLSLRAKETDTSIFSTILCNCWCTHWAEVHIRRPTGNIAWIMRIENEQELAEVFPEFSLADISNLFKSGKETTNQPPDGDEFFTNKIDSQSLGENEYEDLLEQHFHGNSDAFTRAVLPSPQDAGDKKDTGLPDGFTEQALRKTASSPELQPDQVISATASRHLLQVSNVNNPNKRASLDSQTSTQTDKVALATRLSDTLSMVNTLDERSASDTSLLDRPLLKSSHAAKASSASILDSKGSSRDGRVGESMGTASAPGSPPIGSNVSAPATAKSVESIHEIQSRTSSHSQLRKARGHTISSLHQQQDLHRPSSFEHVSPRQLHRTGHERGGVKDLVQGGINPSFIFLQLFHQHTFAREEDRPLLLPKSETMERSMKLLDMIYPHETHKIGVIYVAPGQTQDQTGILSNEYGSPRYMSFLGGLGHLLRLRDCNPKHIYLGGLDHEQGKDGQFAIAWHDEFMQVIFHIATLMPVCETDPNCNAKKLHIGNDYVTIVYNDSCDTYTIGTIKGQFNYVNIVIHPLDHNSNAVTVQCKSDIADIIGHTDTKIICDAKLPLLVRQMAIHANLASTVLARSNPRDPYASNWLERLRHMKRIRLKVIQEHAQQARSTAQESNVHLEDFTDYC